MPKTLTGLLLCLMLTSAVESQPLKPHAEPWKDVNGKSNSQSCTRASSDAERLRLEAEVSRLKAENEELKKKLQADEQRRNSSADVNFQKGAQKKTILQFHRTNSEDSTVRPEPEAADFKERKN